MFILHFSNYVNCCYCSVHILLKFLHSCYLGCHSVILFTHGCNEQHFIEFPFVLTPSSRNAQLGSQKYYKIALVTLVWPCYKLCFTCIFVCCVSNSKEAYYHCSFSSSLPCAIYVFQPTNHCKITEAQTITGEVIKLWYFGSVSFTSSCAWTDLCPM